MNAGDRIQQAREIAGLTQLELAELSGVEQSYISMLESGQRTKPSQDVLETIALRTGFPPAFFQRPRGPDFPEGSLLFRKRKFVSRAEHSRVLQYSRLAFELCQELSRLFQKREVLIPKLTDGPRTAARATRSALGFSPDVPIRFLTHAIERAGVVVIPLPVQVKGFDGFSAWVEDTPLIVLSNGPDESGDRYRLTLAHELGHLVLHRSLSGNMAQAEKEAFLFGSELLFPHEVMLGEMNPPFTLTELAEAKARWGVSMQALIMKACAENIISEMRKKYLFQRLSKKGWRREEPVPIPVERPRLLKKMAEMAYGVPINVERVASLVNGRPRLIADILDHCADRGQPAQQSSRPDNEAPVVEFEAHRNRFRASRAS